MFTPVLESSIDTSTAAMHSHTVYLSRRETFIDTNTAIAPPPHGG